MKLSARNCLKGKVKKIIAGAVNSEVILELPGGITVTSIVTKDAVESLGLKEGKEAYAVIKASSVMLAVDH
jgi:molybdopterin-binding protein